MAIEKMNIIRCFPCCRIINKKEKYFVLNDKAMCTNCMEKTKK